MPTAKKPTKKTPSKKKKDISTDIQKPIEKTEIQELFAKQWIYASHPQTIYETIGSNIAKIRAWDKDPELMEYINTHFLRINDFSHSHWNLANTVPEKIATSVVEVANNLIEEYHCETTLEKTLCEVIANSYGKILSISKRLDDSLSFDYFGHERNGFISIMSKELERANRSYLSAMSELIEMKKPHTSINIKTKNAYIAQNQQINTNQDANVENIKD